jgi:hypothetical protein
MDLASQFSQGVVQHFAVFSFHFRFAQLIIRQVQQIPWVCTIQQMELRLANKFPSLFIHEILDDHRLAALAGRHAPSGIPSHLTTVASLLPTTKISFEEIQGGGGG